MGVYARGKKSKYAKSKPKAKTAVDKKQNKRLAHIEKVFKPEIKRYIVTSPTDVVLTQSTNDMQRILISEMAQGDSVVTRTGNVINVTKIAFKLTSIVPSADGGGPYAFRCMLVQDNTYGGVTGPQGSNILQQYATTDQSYINFISEVNENYVDNKDQGKKGIRVLYDKMYMYSASRTDSAGRHVFKFTKKYKTPLKINYSASTGATGQIFLLLFPGADTTAGSNPLYGWTTTLYFSDA